VSDFDRRDRVVAGAVVVLFEDIAVALVDGRVGPAVVAAAVVAAVTALGGIRVGVVGGVGLAGVFLSDV